MSNVTIINKAEQSRTQTERYLKIVDIIDKFVLKYNGSVQTHQQYSEYVYKRFYFETSKILFNEVFFETSCMFFNTSLSVNDLRKNFVGNKITINVYNKLLEDNIKELKLGLEDIKDVNFQINIYEGPFTEYVRNYISR